MSNFKPSTFTEQLKAFECKTYGEIDLTKDLDEIDSPNDLDSSYPLIPR